MFNRDVDNIDSNFRSAEQGIKFQESMEEVYHISVSFSEVSCFFFLDKCLARRNCHELTFITEVY